MGSDGQRIDRKGHGLTMNWFAAFGATMFFAAFAVTRGGDGSPIAFFVLFGVLAVIYWVCNLWVLRIWRFWQLALQLVWLELCSVAGMFVSPSLEAMAGMLYLWIPAAVLAMVIVNAPLLVFVRPSER